MNLHKNQIAILRFVQKRYIQNYNPSYDEIAEELGIGKTTVSYHVNKLEKFCLVKKGSAGDARSLRVTPEGIEAIALSLMTWEQKQLYGAGIPNQGSLDALNRARHALWEDDDE